MDTNKEFNLYKDIQKRTKGEIYLGVVGPVRTGKSTFIKRFMDLMVLPGMEEDYAKQRALDELPQSSAGKTITTTEPKFIPKEAANISLDHETDVKVRLVDCVGFMVEGATGHMEEEKERLVQTPWFEKPIPFTKAAEYGTEKVIQDHSTIGIVITTDGSFGELPRAAYVAPEEKTIGELKQLNKPFIVLVNSAKPYSEETKLLASELENKYQVSSVAVNAEQLKKEYILKILEKVLYEFPLTKIEFFMPKWVDMLPITHTLKKELIQGASEILKFVGCIKDILTKPDILSMNNEYVRKCKIDRVDMADGTITVDLDVDDKYYYEMLSEMIGDEILNEYHLLSVIKDLSQMKREYSKVMHAMESVRFKGYGVVTPERDEIKLDAPEVIRHGNKFGVKIKAQSPSIHMIRANIETEIAPIVGTQQQAEDLIKYISDAQKGEMGIWDTNIFGKTVEQLVNDGITGKIATIGEESQLKLQETMQKIVNDMNGGMDCIII